MDDLNGIEVKDKIEENFIYTKIIFISNHQDKVLNAFGKNVIGYIDKNKLGYLDLQISKFVRDWKDDETLIIDNKAFMVKDIYYLEADGAYTNLHLIDKTLLQRKTLKEFDDFCMKHGFYRVHKSYAVNLRHIKLVSSTLILLTNNVKIKISRGIHDQIKIAHFNYIKERSLWK